jgi:hypothetical protein
MFSNTFCPDYHVKIILKFTGMILVGLHVRIKCAPIEHSYDIVFKSGIVQALLSSFILFDITTYSYDYLKSVW